MTQETWPRPSYAIFSGNVTSTHTLNPKLYTLTKPYMPIKAGVKNEDKGESGACLGFRVHKVNPLG